jgi:hypothetical protein
MGTVGTTNFAYFLNNSLNSSFFKKIYGQGVDGFFPIQIHAKSMGTSVGILI